MGDQPSTSAFVLEVNDKVVAAPYLSAGLRYTPVLMFSAVDYLPSNLSAGWRYVTAGLPTVNCTEWS